MLDSFLEVACGREQEKVAQARLVETMRKLPEEYLHKLASGEEKLAFGMKSIGGSHHEGWLGQFKGTPLFEQALELEKESLQQQMSEQAQYREQDAQRIARNAAMDELCLKRKLLEIQLAEAEAGVGMEDELEMAEAAEQEMPGGPEDEALEEEAAAEGEPPEQEAAEQAAAPPEDSKPKVDVKVAAANMRFQLALQKMASQGKQASVKKEAIGLGMLGKAVGGAAKSIGGAGMNVAKSARGFGAGNIDAAKMGLGAARAEAGKVMPKVVRAGQSYVKNNPMQAAGLAGAAGLGTGLALG